MATQGEEHRQKPSREYNAEGAAESARQGRRPGMFRKKAHASAPNVSLLLNRPNGVALTDGTKTILFLVLREVRAANGR